MGPTLIMQLDVLAAVVAAAATFVATSLDNLLLLVGFRTSGLVPRPVVASGYVAAVVAVSALALASATAVERVLPVPLGWLGLAPISVGLWQGISAIRASPHAGARPSDEQSPGVRAATGGFSTVFLTMLANSGDSLVVMTAFFGDTRSWLDGVAFATFVTMSLVWIRISSVFAERTRPGGAFERFSRYGMPIVLICIGLYILADTPTDFVRQ